MEKALRNQPPGDETARIAAAFSELAATPELNLLHRYEARLHRIYQRALFNLALLGERELPKEPSPISEHLVVQVPGGPDLQGPLAPPDSGVSDLPMLNCG
jgi:hypothetical protein